MVKHERGFSYNKEQKKCFTRKGNVFHVRKRKMRENGGICRKQNSYNMTKMQNIWQKYISFLIYNCVLEKMILLYYNEEIFRII